MIRAKIPTKYEYDAEQVANTISSILKANGLDPGIGIYSNGRVVLNAESIPAAVRTQIKAAILPLLTDTSGDPDLTV